MEKEVKPYFKTPFYPEHAVKQVFEETRANDLTDELNSWLPVSLVNTVGQYEKPEERKSLIVFIDDFKELIEVMAAPYFLNKAFFLTSKEFTKKYSIGYVRQEIFDLFVSAATYEGPLEIMKGFAGTYYLYYITLADAAFLLNNENQSP